MVTISLSDTSAAYLAAGAIISAMLFFARRNHKQGWRKQRTNLFEAQMAAASRAFVSTPVHAVASDQPLQHLNDLSRLRQALTVHGEPQSPAKETNRNNVLA